MWSGNIFGGTFNIDVIKQSMKQYDNDGPVTLT